MTGTVFYLQEFAILITYTRVWFLPEIFIICEGTYVKNVVLFSCPTFIRRKICARTLHRDNDISADAAPEP